MRKLFSAILALFIAAAPAVAQVNLGDLLGGLAGGSSSSSSDSSTGGLGQLGSLISGLIGSKQLEEADLSGVYKYSEPAVTFRSDNLLQKAGGAAMASMIVNKIAPYYQKAGVDKLEVTINPDKTFSFLMGRMKLSGTFSRDSSVTDANVFLFNFKALKGFSIGKIDTYVQKTGNNLVLTFDVSKLLKIVNSVAKISGKQSLQTAANFLNSYDGLNCGFSLNRVGDSTVAATQTATQTTAPAATSTPAADSSATQQGSQASSAIGGLLNALKKRNSH